MKIYELAYIISSELTSGEAGVKASEVESFIREAHGVILKSEKVSIETLAYPIKKHSSGHFAVLEFQINEDKIKELKTFLGKDPKILRSLIVVKKPARVLKARRARKSLFGALQDKYKETTGAAVSPGQERKGAEKLDAADLDKKLDEILGL